MQNLPTPLLSVESIIIAHLFLSLLDVVRAYRGALKEKEALESTLKALSVQQEEVEEVEEGEEEGIPNERGSDNQRKEEVFVWQ